MGLLAGEDVTLESGDKNILRFKFMEQLSDIAAQHFIDGKYNKYNVLAYLGGILRRTTVHQLLDSLNFTSKEVLDFMKLDVVEKMTDTVYDIQDPSDRKTYIKVFATASYAKRILKGDDSVCVNVITKGGPIHAEPIESFNERMYHKLRRSLLGVRFEFTTKFRQEVCNFITDRVTLSHHNINMTI